MLAKFFRFGGKIHYINSQDQFWVKIINYSGIAMDMRQ